MHTCEELQKLVDLSFAQGETAELIGALTDALGEAQDDFDELGERVQIQVGVLRGFIGCNARGVN